MSETTLRRIGWALWALTILLLYPDGHLPSRRWRPLLWLMVTVMAMAFVATAFGDVVDPNILPNVLGVAAFTPLFEVILDVVFLAQPVLTLLAVVSVVARYRESAGEVRQQVKVLLWVVPVTVAVFIFGAVNQIEAVWLDPVLNFAFTVFVASAVTLAILRFRLFEIDRLISRTVTYAIVLGAMAAVYVVGGVWLPRQLVGRQTPLFVAGSTLVVFLLFQPIRRRVMRWVDRRFNRSRYDPEQIGDELGRRLRSQVDADHVAEDRARVVVRALHPSAVGVWVRD